MFGEIVFWTIQFETNCVSWPSVLIVCCTRKFWKVLASTDRWKEMADEPVGETRCFPNFLFTDSKNGKILEMTKLKMTHQKIGRRWEYTSVWWKTELCGIPLCWNFEIFILLIKFNWERFAGEIFELIIFWKSWEEYLRIVFWDIWADNILQILRRISEDCILRYLIW